MMWRLVTPVALAAMGLDQAPSVGVTLVSEVVTLRPGDSFHVAAEIEIPKGWHIGWINPGQSGLPTTLAWRLPAAVHADLTTWSYPQLADSAGVVSHVYTDKALVVTSMHLDSGAGPGTVRFAAELHWGICREICIPQDRQVAISLPVTRGPPESAPIWARVEAIALADIPIVPSRISVKAERTAGGVRLRLQAHGTGVLPHQRVTFFPNAPQGASGRVLPVHPSQGVLTFTLPSLGSGGRLVGVLVSDRPWGEPGGPLALALDLPVIE